MASWMTGEGVGEEKWERNSQTMAVEELGFNVGERARSGNEVGDERKEGWEDG